MVWLCLSVVLWGVLHSVLAGFKAKRFFENFFGERINRLYRLGYNLFSVLSFLPILWLMATLPDRPLYAIPSPWIYVTGALQLAVLVLLVIGVSQTDALSFIGIRQLTQPETEQLVVTGLYRWVRHPLYTAGLLLIWLTPLMTVNRLVVFAALTVYIVIGAMFEEKKMLRTFGQAYADYKLSTPMLLPGLTPGNKKR